MTDRLLIKNCRIIDAPEGPRDVLIKQGAIDFIGAWTGGETGLQIIDATGLSLLPGFVDLHVQGAGGADVLDGTDDALATIGSTVARLGTVGYLATTIYFPDGDDRHLEVVREAMNKDFNGARILGIHLEGPFASRAKLGGLPPDAVCAADHEHLDRILDLCGPALKMMTIAPELPGALDVIEKLVDRGIVASFGHSDADYDQTRRGLEAGISHVTHLFNTMRGIHHRAAGPIPALVEADPVTAQLICDGAHLAAPVVRLAANLMGPRRLCTITDGGRPLGTSAREFVYAGKRVFVRDGVLRDEQGLLFGTALGLNELVGRLSEFARWEVPDAVRAGSITAKSVLGLARADDPLIHMGQTADLLLAAVDHQRIEPKVTFVAGNVVWRAGV